MQGFKDGNCSEAKFMNPKRLALDLNSNCLYVSDDDRIRRISLAGKTWVNTLFDNEKNAVKFDFAEGIAISSGMLYVNCRGTIKRIEDRKALAEKQLADLAT